MDGRATTWGRPYEKTSAFARFVCTRRSSRTTRLADAPAARGRPVARAASALTCGRSQWNPVERHCPPGKPVTGRCRIGNRYGRERYDCHGECDTNRFLHESSSFRCRSGGIAAPDRGYRGRARIGCRPRGGTAVTSWPRRCYSRGVRSRPAAPRSDLRLVQGFSHAEPRSTRRSEIPVGATGRSPVSPLCRDSPHESASYAPRATCRSPLHGCDSY
jgi:hypothetical protein